MKELLMNKKIAVFGAGGLIGSHLVVKLLGQQAKVIAVDINLGNAKARLEGMVPPEQLNDIEFIQADITNEADVQGLFASWQNLDGVVNAAYPRNAHYGDDFLKVSLSSFNDNLNQNLGSAFLVMQQSAKYFLEHKKPLSVVNFSSIYGVVPPRWELYEGTNMSNPVEYAAIKSAIQHLAKYTAVYVDSSDFKINCVSFGGILDGQPESFLAAYKNQTLGTGMLEVEKALGAVLFLLSEQSNYINGQNILVDDGFCL